MSRNSFRGSSRSFGAKSPTAETLRHGSLLLKSGKLAEAEAVYRRILRQTPGDPVANYNLGVVLLRAGRHAEAAAANRRALAGKPDMALAHYQLGLALSNLGQKAAALEAYRNAVASDPRFAEAHSNLGCAFLEAHTYLEAELSFREAIRLDPTCMAARINLSDVLRIRGRMVEAAGEARQAIVLNPDSHFALNLLANALRFIGHTDVAVAMFRRALRLAPGSALLHNNLGNGLRDLGDAKAAIAEYRRVLALAPDSANTHSSLIFTLDFDAAVTTEEQQAERKRWWLAHGEHWSRNILPHPNRPEPERRLRIGYYSAHFNQSSSASVFGPIIRGHDRERFDVICYSGTTTDDAITESIRRQATLWRSTLGLGDEALAQRIRDDGIDILVDTVGHMAGHRLATFARKPAPVQVTAWGQATGTGLPTIDYLFSDPVMIPEFERAFFAERVADLPCVLTYAPPLGFPEVSAPPAITRGYLTFGSFNRESKATPETLALWCQVLAALPGSRLLLKYAGWLAADNRSRVVATLGAFGIAPERIEFRGRTDQLSHLAAYADVDIALDPIPISGGITSLEALWMGVPVITLRGRTAAGRSAASFMTTLGLSDWIAETPAEYARIAVTQAADLRGLADLRTRLRALLLASPIGDTARYTRAVETAYCNMWRRWCASAS